MTNIIVALETINYPLRVNFEMFTDNYNKLYISGGLDYQVKVQRLAETQDTDAEMGGKSQKKLEDFSLKSPQEIMKQVKDIGKNTVKRHKVRPILKPNY